MIMWFFIAGLILYGAFHIIVFAKSEIKNGWSLTSGIMAVLLGVLLIFSDPFLRASTFGVYARFHLPVNRNEPDCRFLCYEKAGCCRNWLASGIWHHYIFLLIFLIFNPFVMLLGFGIIAGVYLIFGGIALFAESMSTHI